MSYLHIDAERTGKAAWLKKVEGFEETWLLDSGVPLAGKFPKDAVFKMNKDMKERIALHDFMPNGQHLLVVSEPAKKFFEDAKLQHVEYLPATIVNQKDKKVKEPYFIVHSYPRVDCVDPAKTKHKPNLIDSEQWMQVSEVTLIPSKIPPDFQLFMATHVPWLRLISGDLAAQLKRTKLKGFTLTDPKAFTV